MTLGTLKTIGRLLVYEGKTQQTKGRLWLLADEQARFNARVASPDFRAPVALCILEEV